MIEIEEENETAQTKLAEKDKVIGKLQKKVGRLE